MDYLLPKRRWKASILVPVGAAAAIVVALILDLHSARENVSVSLVGVTNSSGRKVCIFRGTNGNEQAITYTVDLETTNAVWRMHVMVHRGGPIPAGQSFTFLLDAPTDPSA